MGLIMLMGRMLSGSAVRGLVFLGLWALAGAGHAVESPPRNPFLADSGCPIGHCSSAQQDAFSVAGPLSESRALGADELDFAPVGQLHMGPAFSGRYADGRRVVWSNGIDRIAKVDYDSFEVLAEYVFPGAKRTTEAEADEHIESMNRNNSGMLGIWNTLKYTSSLSGMAGIYTLLDRDHRYFIGSKDGSIGAYGDADPTHVESPIEEKRRFRLPENVTGTMVGMNMTHDGWLIVATDEGWLLSIARDFSEHRAIQLTHAAEVNFVELEEGAEWIRNGFAIDPDGGIYIASTDHLHKVVWTGDRLSKRVEDGAWVAKYPNGAGKGTGSTPSLMGFGEDEDRLVVISDGDELMNVTLFWRDEIPADWRGLMNGLDRRVAGTAPANLGDPALETFQTEQSLVVAGYGVLVVNNIPRNRPWYFPSSQRLDFLFLVGFMGSHPNYQPFGVQKFEWDSANRKLRSIWVNGDVSSPNGVPAVSIGSDTVYLVGARNNSWTIEAIDWQSGASRFHWVMGGQRFNGFGSSLIVDDEGRLHFGASWGRVRVRPSTEN